MAIFGHLADLPFPEIFNMLGRRTGRLDIHGAADAHDLSLHLHDGELRGLTIDGELIDDPLQVRDRLGVLMDSSAGVFEFHRCAREELTEVLALPMPQLLLSIATEVDEISAFRARFAHPRTRFREVTAGDLWLDDDLYDFFERAKPLLSVGSDAEELARALDLGLDQVQLHLYKLRSVGRIAPVRAADEASATPLLKPLDAEVPPRIARDHLFGDLFDGPIAEPVAASSSTATRFEEISFDATQSRATQPENQGTSTAPSSSAPRGHRRGRGLFRRLLDAFRQQAGAAA